METQIIVCVQHFLPIGFAIFFLVSKFFPQWTLFFLWDWSNPEVNNAFWNLWEGLGTYCIPPAYSRNSTYMMVESRVKISTFKRLPFHRIELANKAKLLWRRFFSPVPIFESSLYFEFFFNPFNFLGGIFFLCCSNFWKGHCILRFYSIDLKSFKEKCYLFCPLFFFFCLEKQNKISMKTCENIIIYSKWKESFVLFNSTIWVK